MEQQLDQHMCYIFMKI